MAGVGALALSFTAHADEAPAPVGGPESLKAALVAAYATNPTLLAARDTLRATDEGVPLARADGLPSASLDVSETEYLRQSPYNTVSTPRMLGAQATLSVPIYSGGAVHSAIKAADARVSAGQDSLRGSESSVFSQTVAAFMDVRLNAAIVGLNRSNVEALRVNLRATTDRFQIGEVTRTDIAQSQSRLAVAESQLRSAQANLANARETYIQIIGHAPGQLETPPDLPGLPASPEEAEAQALDRNPDLAAAHQRSAAAGHDVRTAKAANLPRVSLFADGAYANYLGPITIPGYPANLFPQSSTTADVGIRATIPLYSGGRPSAQLRQAEATESASLNEEIGTERQVIATVRAAYSSWQAALAIIESSKVAVEASRLSLEGVRAENSVGNRTVLDILNAEQELLNAQVQLETARRNAYVAGFTLLAAMGRAEARDLGLESGTLYDPTLHARAARRTLDDWSGDGHAAPRATRSIDTPVQNGTITQQGPAPAPAS